MGAAVLAAGLVVTASLLTDLAYAWLDPRVRLS
jgi:ABC-type dipeptide/oligopeptide/nickel transport system permease component